MKIRIKPVNIENIGDINQCDGVFMVDSKLNLNVEQDEIDYQIVNIPRYEKRYAKDEVDHGIYVNHPDKMIFLAYVGDQIAGQIILRKNWNQYAYIEDIVVDIQYRKMGVGKALISEAKKWARAKTLRGVMCETQNNNVGACLFYESCGFQLGGFDKNLYSGLQSVDEIALYWYYLDQEWQNKEI